MGFFTMDLVVHDLICLLQQTQGVESLGGS